MGVPGTCDDDDGLVVTVVPDDATGGAEGAGPLARLARSLSASFFASRVDLTDEILLSTCVPLRLLLLAPPAAVRLVVAAGVAAGVEVGAAAGLAAGLAAGVAAGLAAGVAAGLAAAARALSEGALVLGTGMERRGGGLLGVFGGWGGAAASSSFLAISLSSEVVSLDGRLSFASTTSSSDFELFQSFTAMPLLFSFVADPMISSIDATCLRSADSRTWTFSSKGAICLSFCPKGSSVYQIEASASGLLEGSSTTTAFLAALNLFLRSLKFNTSVTIPSGIFGTKGIFSATFPTTFVVVEASLSSLLLLSSAL
mmetsp:Transcript_32366/g.81557  ORF Transcript_32366/g.81557 Transcript_32366/m.81557 type:complete len:313 (-) Transcript_32366:211-1149(-)